MAIYLACCSMASEGSVYKMSGKKKLPVGVDSFEKLRTLGFYYIDKTGLIKELVDNWGEANLFTRPRRFGKSLNMSMLKYFFEYGSNGALFEGLAVAQEKEICEEYMGKFPVISVSLKDVNEACFEDAVSALRSIIGAEALRFKFLLESDRLAEMEKKQYQGLIDIERGSFTMSTMVLKNSLWLLSALLFKHYGQKAIILIDEYDVPLDKAQQNGYYDQMAMLIRNMFSKALKSNDSLYFAVLTGCLRISKESIFTGLNNLKILSITNVQFDEYFGFTDDEVQGLLRYYDMEEKYGTVKKWYDGYRFGKRDVYCPWDVINYVQDAMDDPNTEPRAYWLNTSENIILRRFLQMATKRTVREIEKLINGESIRKKVSQELTYKELYDNIDNIWSVLFTTGYLTQRGEACGDVLELTIPNLEVRKIFIDQVTTWFKNKTGRDPQKLNRFCLAFQKSDVKAIEVQMGAYLNETIGIHDYSIRQELKENYYHGLLVGLLTHCEDWDITSNAEAGDGYSDIQMEMEEGRLGIVIEIKCPKDGDLDTGCREALQQIRERRYETRLLNDGMKKILKYGIAFYKKECRVALED